MKRQNNEFLVAVEAAKEAGKLILQQAGKRKIVGFKTKIDFVTNVDKNSEELITSIIRKNFPDHGILAEEGTSAEGENMWVIDPLDGTTNFMHGYPFFCVSIALIKKGRQAMGVVYDPIRNEMFHAIAGQGAYLNGRKIKVSGAKEVKDSLLVTGFYYERGDIMRKTLDKMGAFLSLNVHGVRRDGSAALDMCYVACGRLDGYWEYVLSPWDFAAASLIAKEAGAVVTTAEGSPIGMKKAGVIAANRNIHKKMLEILKRP
jgi:myo-inositol-1(or 4)-monophosphatase